MEWVTDEHEIWRIRGSAWPAMRWKLAPPDPAAPDALHSGPL